VFEISYLSNYSLKYNQMKASFKVMQFKSLSYNALNGHNVKEIFLEAIQAMG